MQSVCRLDFSGYNKAIFRIFLDEKYPKGNFWLPIYTASVEVLQSSVFIRRLEMVRLLG